MHIKHYLCQYMKRFAVIILMLLPLGLAAQGKHHFEAGVGYALPAELLAGSLPTQENNSICLYGEYRYQFTKSFSAGLNYGFVPGHKGLPPITDAEHPQPDFAIKTRYHGINAVAEYKFSTSGPLAFFVGLGGGAQYRNSVYYKYVEPPLKWDDEKLKLNSDPARIWSADVFVRVGLEIYNHLRITVGHLHDLHYPVSAISSGAPYYYFSIGWSF